MEQSRDRKGLFEILLVSGLILITPLFFVVRSQAQGVKPTATKV
jgi:hypothetical protein